MPRKIDRLNFDEAESRLDRAQLVVARWATENETLLVAALRAYNTREAREEAEHLHDLMRDWRAASEAVARSAAYLPHEPHRGSKA